MDWCRRTHPARTPILPLAQHYSPAACPESPTPDNEAGSLSRLRPENLQRGRPLSLGLGRADRGWVRSSDPEEVLGQPADRHTMPYRRAARQGMEVEVVHLRLARESGRRPTEGTSLRRTTSSASSLTVQRARPSGGGEQTTAKMLCCCCCSMSRAGALPGRAASNTARSTPPCWYRLPTCHTALAESIRLAPTAGVGCPCSICSNAKARFTVRTA